MGEHLPRILQQGSRGRGLAVSHLLSMYKVVDLSPALGWGVEGRVSPIDFSFVSSCVSFQLTVEMFDYLECELNLFQTGKSLPS